MKVAKIHLLNWNTFHIMAEELEQGLQLEQPDYEKFYILMNPNYDTLDDDKVLAAKSLFEKGEYEIAASFNLKESENIESVYQHCQNCQNENSSNWLNGKNISEKYSKEETLRSLSVGDIVEIDGIFWFCDARGWQMMSMTIH